MEEIRKISKEQIVMAFVATCIETTARQLGIDYSEIYQRMNWVGMIENYIMPNYEPLHSESREILAERLIECLNNWEKNYNNPTKSPVVQEIIMSNRIGAITILLAKQLNIDNVKALKLFYESGTCRKLHDKSTGLYLFGDLYIVDEFMREMENRQ